MCDGGVVSASSSGYLANHNSNNIDRTNGDSRRGNDYDLCLKSFCIYCPSLSGWKEERAMDSILFFFPPRTQKNAQANHVGFCIGASCLTERFAAVVPMNEIRTAHSIISLYCPFPDLWMAVEVTPVYDSAAVVPIVRLGFDVFTMRYGRSTVAALVSTDGSYTTEEVSVARVSLKDFFEKFTLFLQTRVLVLDIRQAVAMSGGVLLPVEPSSSSTVGGDVNHERNNSSSNSSGSRRGRLANAQRCSRRWAAVANTESLLAFPVFMRAAPQAVQFTCHSLICCQLSLFLTELSQSDSAGGETSTRGIGIGHKKSCTVSWGQEYQGVTAPIDLSQLNKSAEERLLWTSCKYVVFAEETLKVIASNASHKLVSQFISLLLIETSLSDFTAFIDNEAFYCCICRSSSGVILALLVNSDLLSSSTHNIIHLTCQVIADDIAEYLLTGSCSFMREGYLGPVERERMTLGPYNAPHISRNCSPLSYTTAMTTSSFFSAPPRFPRLRDTKLTFQWTVWYNGVIAGSPMREYPRVVHLLMASIMRTLIQRVPEVNRKEDSVDSHVENSPSHTAQLREGSSPTTSDMLPCCLASSDAVAELWTPLYGATWLCVIREHGRVGGMVFYNCAPLKSCFEAVAQLRQYMSLLV